MTVIVAETNVNINSVIAENATIVSHTDIETVAVIAENNVSTIISSTTLIPASNLSNINLSNLQDGSLLVYSTTTNEWVAKNTLDSQIIDSGQF